MPLKRICAGCYQAKSKSGKNYLIENVTHDAGKVLWIISAIRFQGLDVIRSGPCDAADSLKEAKELVEGWE